MEKIELVLLLLCVAFIIGLIRVALSDFENWKTFFTQLFLLDFIENIIDAILDIYE